MSPEYHPFYDSNSLIMELIGSYTCSCVNICIVVYYFMCAYTYVYYDTFLDTVCQVEPSCLVPHVFKKIQMFFAHVQLLDHVQKQGNKVTVWEVRFGPSYVLMPEGGGGVLRNFKKPPSAAPLPFVCIDSLLVGGSVMQCTCMCYYLDM